MHQRTTAEIGLVALLLVVAFFSSLSSASPLPQVMSASSMGQFWEEHELGSAVRTLSKRELGTLDRWRYINFDGSNFRRMTLDEQHYSIHLLAGITTYRSFGENGSLAEDAKFYPNTVVPAVDGAKYLADLWALDQGNTPPAAVVSAKADLQQWACDLDWKQPDPDGDGSTVFSAEDGWCSLESQVVLFKVTSLDQGKQAVALWADDNRFANIQLACRSRRTAGVRHYYCAAIFADLQQARTTTLLHKLSLPTPDAVLWKRANTRLQVLYPGSCSACCSPSACVGL